MVWYKSATFQSRPHIYHESFWMHKWKITFGTDTIPIVSHVCSQTALKHNALLCCDHWVAIVRVSALHFHALWHSRLLGYLFWDYNFFCSNCLRLRYSQLIILLALGFTVLKSRRSVCFALIGLSGTFKLNL